MNEYETSLFYKAVLACLTDIWEYDAADAQRMVADFRQRLSRYKGRAEEIVLHNEPFNLAAELADRHLDLKDHEAEYEIILANTAGRPDLV
jgi:hypothetical protein